MFTVARKGEHIVIKEGERFMDKATRKIYLVKMVEKDEVLLVGENGLGRRITSGEILKRTCEKLEEKTA